MRKRFWSKLGYSRNRGEGDSSNDLAMGGANSDGADMYSDDDYERSEDDMPYQVGVLRSCTPPPRPPHSPNPRPPHSPTPPPSHPPNPHPPQTPNPGALGGR